MKTTLEIIDVVNIRKSENDNIFVKMFDAFVWTLVEIFRIKSVLYQDVHFRYTKRIVYRKWNTLEKKPKPTVDIYFEIEIFNIPFFNISNNNIYGYIHVDNVSTYPTYTDEIVNCSNI